MRRLMPFTALKHLIPVPLKIDNRGCAPPNAVYGIETRGDGAECPPKRVVRRLMPFTALKQ